LDRRSRPCRSGTLPVCPPLERGLGSLGSPPPAARGARVAVAILFFVNGALFANVVPRYPDLKAGLELSNAAFGFAVAAYGAGALVVGLMAGVLVSRWGSARVARASTVGIAGNLVLLAVAPSWSTLAAALFIAGSLDAIADVAGNVHGLRVERLYRRSILNSLHGMWSIGAVVGGTMGAAAAGLGLPLVWHLSIAAAVFATLAVSASRFLLPGHDDTERTATDALAVGRLPRMGRVRIAGSVMALGLIAALAQVMEDSSATWGAVYLREDLGAAAAVSGLAFVALQASQIVGRLIGDRVVTRHGDRAVARMGASIGGIAMAGALAVPAPVTTVLAFGVVGLGIGTLIPASMRAADDIPGLPRGVGLTLVGSVDRIAILVSPALIGIMADAFSLRAALIVVPLAAALLFLLAPALPGSPIRRPVKSSV
jgi:MFS family permease